MEYRNEDFEQLFKLKDKIKSTIVVNQLTQIKKFYTAFNKKAERCTQRYKDAVITILNQFPIKVVDGLDGAKLLQISNKTVMIVSEIEQALQQYIDKFQTIKYLEFLSEENRNVVFVGPNGSGKTTLLRKLKADTAGAKIYYITADRALLVDDSFQPKRDYDAFIKDLKNSYEYAIDLESSLQGNQLLKQFDYYVNLLERERNDEKEKGVANSVTEKIISFWHELVKDRELYFEHGLCVRPIDGTKYPLKYLSSGEKSILYFLVSILLQGEQDFYFIDEPENNLNPAIVSKLWNFIQSQRPNSIFVYLTHNGEFVASRVNAKIYWIKKYNGTDWEWEELPENTDLPQELMISLVGNREPIIFCESHDEYKYDSQIYKLMFPEFKVVSSGGCDKVKSRVAAYKQAGLPHKVFGIIDCDYRQEEYLNGLSADKIYSIPFFEIEGFLLSERVLSKVVEENCAERDQEETIENIKNAIKQKFISLKNAWIAKHVAFDLRNQFDYHGKIKSLANMEDLKQLYSNERKDETELDAIATAYEHKFDEIVNTNSHDLFLRHLDYKGMLKELQHLFKFQSNFSYDTAAMLFFLKEEGKQLLATLRSEYFPLINTDSD